MNQSHYLAWNSVDIAYPLFRDGTDLDDVQDNRGCADEVAIEVRLEGEQGDDDLFLIPCARIGGRAWNDPGGGLLTKWLLRPALEPEWFECRRASRMNLSVSRL